MRDSLTASAYGIQRVEHVTAFFMVVLVLAWLVVFLPSTTRHHRAPLASTERFKRDLETIALPRHSLALALSLAPRRALNVRSFRLFLFLFMSGCVAVTFAGFFVRGSSVLEAHLLADAALMLYVAWLLEEKKKRPPKASRPASRIPTSPSSASQVSGPGHSTRVESASPVYWDVRILPEDESSKEEVLEEQMA